MSGSCERQPEISTFGEAEGYLDGFVNRERSAPFDYEKTGLARIRALLRELGDPHLGLPSIHVTGSKGKGTVALGCEAVLRAAGLRVGTYTSPHLSSWLERYRIDGCVVAREVFVAALERARPAIERLRRDPQLCPSFFDVTTALAFALFREQGVEAGVIEVGLGGRLDSTSVTTSRVSVLTTVQLEHTDKLGNTLAAIAGEKVAILRKGSVLVHGPLDPSALEVVQTHVRAMQARAEQVEPRCVELGEAGLRFSLDAPTSLRTDLRPGADADGVTRLAAPVLGRAQATNLALAVRACEHFLGRRLSLAEASALGALELPGRLERIGDAVLDCAHTPDSARELRETLAALWPGRSWLLGFSISRDKDAAGVLAELAPCVRGCVLTFAEPTRSLDPESLVATLRAAGIENLGVEPAPLAALRQLLELRRPGEGVLIAGSFYLAGALRDALLESPPGRR